ncbi:hypothetical protein GS444_20520 [Rhodococcus hoagii]|nr:hypothetical protein [Prescottella equi]
MGWGAHVGVTSAQLAAAGFTAHRSEFVAGRPCGDDTDLGTQWPVMRTYVKPVPVLPLGAPGLAGAAQVLRMLGRERLDPADVTECRSGPSGPQPIWRGWCRRPARRPSSTWSGRWPRTSRRRVRTRLRHK